MEIQIAIGFGAMQLIKLTFGFWPSVGETIIFSIFLRLLFSGSLANRAEIDNVSHDYLEHIEYTSCLLLQ